MQAPPQASAPPQAQIPTGQMMQNVPEQCRSMMQSMPQNCMGMMQQMMGGGMMRGGMHGQSGLGTPWLLRPRRACRRRQRRPTSSQWRECTVR
jgi:hypothetical protein